MKFSGKQVAAARELLGITQAELAEAVGLDWHILSSFESGKSEPRRANLNKIAAELERRGIAFTNETGIGVHLDFAKAAEYARSQEEKHP